MEITEVETIYEEELTGDQIQKLEQSLYNGTSRSDSNNCPLVNFNKIKEHGRVFANEVSKKDPITTLVIAGVSIGVGAMLGGQKVIRTALISSLAFVLAIETNIDHKFASLIEL